MWSSASFVPCRTTSCSGSNHGTVSPLLRRLEARHLLSRARTAADERSVTVALTESGRRLRERTVALEPPQNQTAPPRHQEVIMPSRDATTHWVGGLQNGSGQVTLDSSNAGQFTVSFPTRSGNPDGQTSPEELIAAAHSSCLAMNLSGVLDSEKLTASSIDVRAEVTLGPATGGGFEISGIVITLQASVDGVDAAKFAELAKTAEQTCPVSKALTGTTITLDAALNS